MIPSVLSSQVQKGVNDFLGTTFPVSTPFFHGMMNHPLHEKIGDLIKKTMLLPLDEETAEFYARIYWDVKKKGKPIPTNDLWVAASAMRHGLALFTYDEHFADIAGLILHKADL